MDIKQFSKYLSDVRQDAAYNTRIASHAIMEYAFIAAVERKPRLIVELGTGVKGLRTRAIVRAAALYEATHVSVDIQDCRECGNSWYPKWRFLQEDARDVGRKWIDYTKELRIDPKVDVLFIDLDEKYPTTKETWDIWSPFLASSCTVMFRCTNLKGKLIYKNGTSTMLGWDNQRGVIRVVEEIIGAVVNETKEFTLDAAGWTVTHYPWGAGLTILERGSK